MCRKMSMDTDRTSSASQELIVSQLMFYDGPTPPAGIFDDFLAMSEALTALKEEEES